MGSIRKNFTLQERKIIEFEISKRTFITEIARKIGKTPGAVSKEIARLGKGKKYNSQLAHEDAIKKRALGLKNLIPNTPRQQNLYQQRTPQETLFISRIEALEMQMQIVFEFIKEMKKK